MNDIHLTSNHTQHKLRPVVIAITAAIGISGLLVGCGGGGSNGGGKKGDSLITSGGDGATKTTGSGGNGGPAPAATRVRGLPSGSNGRECPTIVSPAGFHWEAKDPRT